MWKTTSKLSGPATSNYEANYPPLYSMWKIQKSQCMWKVHIISTFFSESAVGIISIQIPCVLRQDVVRSLDVYGDSLPELLEMSLRSNKTRASCFPWPSWPKLIKPLRFGPINIDAISILSRNVSWSGSWDMFTPFYRPYCINVGRIGCTFMGKMVQTWSHTTIVRKYGWLP